MTRELRGVCPLLQVYDMPASLRFYRDVLGFEVVSTSPKICEDYFHWVWLKQGRAEVMLNTAYESDEERPTKRDPARTAAHEIIISISVAPMSRRLTKNCAVAERQSSNPKPHPTA